MQEFLSTQLSEIDSKAEIVISSHLSRLDQVSHDIRVLESKLKKAAIPFTFGYILFCKKKFEEVLKRGLDHPDYVVDIIGYEYHCLVWAQTNKHGTRLFYNIYRIECERENEADFEKYLLLGTFPTLCSSKPLIEMKANSRLSAEEQLPFFYKMIIENLQKEDKEDWIFCVASTYEKNSDKTEMSYPYIVCYDNLPVEEVV